MSASAPGVTAVSSLSKAIDPTRAHALSRAEIADALRYVPADDRETWYRMAMAVRDELGDEGFEIWDAWSQRSASYDARSAKQVWKSARKSRRIHVGTLIYAAKANGWKLDSREHPLASATELETRRAERTKQAAATAAVTEEAAARLASEIWRKAKPVDGRAHP